MKTKLTHSPAQIVLALSMIVGLIYVIDTNLVIVPKAPQTIPVSVAFVAVYFAAFYFVFRRLRIWPGNPIWWLAAALMWGGFISSIYVKFAGASLTTFTKQLGFPVFSASLAGALPEEIGKFIGVFLIALAFSQISKPWHVFVVGIFVGLGFTLIENVGYAAGGSMINPTSDVTGAVHVWFLRTLLGFGWHSVYTAVATWGLALALFAPNWSRFKKVVVTLAWAILGFALHFAWNASPTDMTINAIKIGVVLVLSYGLFFVLFFKARSYAIKDQSE